MYISKFKVVIAKLLGHDAVTCERIEIHVT